VNIELASNNILKYFWGEDIDRDNVMSLLKNVTKKYSCPYTLFFFSRSLENQSSKNKINTTLEQLKTAIKWYADKHYLSIHPEDISQEFQEFTSDEYFEKYHPTDWNWRDIKMYRPDWEIKRRKRIIERGSKNALAPIYSSYKDVHSIASYAKENIKNAEKVSEAFSTNEFWGFYAFPYFSPSKKYDLFRAAGSLLWSVSQNQWLTTQKNYPDIEKHFVRFENIESFTSYGVDRYYKTWRFPYYKDPFILKKILTNISNKYRHKFSKEVYKKDPNSWHAKPAPLSFYMQSFNFGIESPPPVLPPFDFLEVLNESAEPVNLWKE